MTFNSYVITYPKQERKIYREILLASFASVYLGFGGFCFMLTFGLNV
jgi:hypothetical protein